MVFQYGNQGCVVKATIAYYSLALAYLKERDRGRRTPAGELVVPDQCVASDLLTVFFGEGYNGFTPGEVEGVP